MKDHEILNDRLRPVILGSLLAAAIGGLACAYGWSVVPERFYAAWLTAYLYWLGLGLGCLAWTMLHGLTGGAWGRVLRRIIESGSQTLPLMAVLFLPIWFNVRNIYLWADPDVVAHHLVLQRKAGYLNVAGYQWRAVVCFVIWVGFCWTLNLFSPTAERKVDSPRSQRLQTVSGMGLVAFGLSVTMAMVDWVMSLEPEWYSTMYGVIHMAGQAVSSLAFALVILSCVATLRPWSRMIAPQRLNDLGNLLMGSVMFWAYVSFMQYLIIWSGNLPEENVWYLHRSQGGWQYLALGLITLHFAVPFLLLLSRRRKRHTTDLFRIAVLLLALRYVDLFWLIQPGFQRGTQAGQHSEAALARTLSFHWLDIVAFITIGGLWLAMFAWSLSHRARLPLYDPGMAEGDHE